MERFLHKIQAFRVHREVEDRVIWTVSRCGTFSVKSLYSILEIGDSPLFPSSSIWRVVCLLRWLSLLGRLFFFFFDR